MGVIYTIVSILYMFKIVIVRIQNYFREHVNKKVQKALV